MFLSTEHNQDLNASYVPAHLLILYFIQVCSRCHLPPAATQSHRSLPIQTSPNWPLPSFLISWRDSRGISHISLVFTDKSASLGMPRLQLPIKRQHSPAALSERERRDKQASERKGKQEGKKTANAEIKKKKRTRQVAYVLMQLTSTKAQGKLSKTNTF